MNMSQPHVISSLDVTREPEPGELELSATTSVRWDATELVLSGTTAPLSSAFAQLSRGRMEVDEGGLFSRETVERDVVYAVVSAGGERVRLGALCTPEQAEGLPWLEQSATLVTWSDLVGLLHALRVAEARLIYEGGGDGPPPERPGHVEALSLERLLEVFPNIPVRSKAGILRWSQGETRAFLHLKGRRFQTWTPKGEYGWDVVISEKDLEMARAAATALLETPPEPLERVDEDAPSVVVFGEDEGVFLEPADPGYGTHVNDLLKLFEHYREPSIRLRLAAVTPRFAKRLALVSLGMGGLMFLSGTQFLQKTSETALVEAASPALPWLGPLAMCVPYLEAIRDYPTRSRQDMLWRCAVAFVVCVGLTLFFFEAIFPGL